MRILILADPPTPRLAQALAGFEQQFTYPLGTDCFFRIEHGADYAQFYRSIGTARCFVAEQDDQVQGVVSAAIRPLLCPDGNEQQVCYLGDLKIAPAARGGRLLLQFQQAVHAWLQNPAIKIFAVVMDGSRSVPSDYSGRAGIPAFTVVGKTMIMRFACDQRECPDDSFVSTEAQVRACYRRLSRGRYASVIGNPAERSLLTPIWLVTPDGSACGCLEDTRWAKRLVANDGLEIMSAHLSAFAFRDAGDGAALIRAACAQAALLNYPALFVAVAQADAQALHAALGDINVVYAPATIYAHGFSPGPAWNIHSSEI